MISFAANDAGWT